MNEQEMPQMQLLLRDEQVRDEIIFLTPTHYQEAIEWIRRHFTFAYGQQIDWSHDANAVTGNMQDLRENALLQLLRQYDVEPTQTLTVIWAYADIGVKLPFSLIARHIHAIWLPIVDDVFVLDTHDTWCLEIFHEGNFSCGMYEKMKIARENL
jgi:hypothetical protein